jgi:holo-[acyl-carrier protein] synthase
MILGIGSDIVHINRIEELIKDFGERFINRAYTKDEIEYSKKFGANNSIGKSSYFAKRFAAKEAFAKAVGTGFRGGLRFSQIGVINDNFGKPHLILTGKALDMLQDMKTGKKIPKPHLSLCDDYPIAQATVIISSD